MPVQISIKSISGETKSLLNLLIDQSFHGLNRLFVLLIENITIRKKKGFYFPRVKMKDYNFMIDGRDFFDHDQGLKSDIRTDESIQKIGTGPGDDITSDCLSDYPYLKENCQIQKQYNKLILQGI